MKIEQIETNKIQVIFSKEELENNDINFHNLMSNSKQTQNLFLAILDIAEKEMGFKTLNYDIAIETLILENSNFIITISRKESENKTLHNLLKISRKKYIKNYALKFNCFDDFYDFFNKIKFNISFNKSLYYFNNNFYYIPNTNSQIQKMYTILALEYASPTSIPIMLIKNYGKPVL